MNRTDPSSVAASARLARRAAFVLLPVVTLLIGCAATEIRPNPLLIPRPLPTTFDDKDWGAILRDHVKSGLVDYELLARNREPLDRYYALISAMGPATAADQFPTKYHRIAYTINAYNALVLLAALEDPSRKTIYALDQPPLETAIRFRLDGKPVRLFDLEKALLAESEGDVRVLFALSGAARGTPALHFEPYRPASFERQLQQAAADALDNPYLLQIDHERRCILVWQEILSHREAFMTFWQQRRRTRAPSLLSVLLDLASPQQRRALNGAIGYEIRPIAFDRRLNRWPDPAAAPDRTP
ncbi:MAG: DUF547 domain-containing protein [Phycisphaerae bacterium]|nr:DUF547 domain-containing protein [Phycisphaerae bacterium]